MSSLKEYRNRIASVKSTRKITSAMKMVAASKLKKSQEAAEASQPYADTMQYIMRHVASGLKIDDSSPLLLKGTGSDQVHLVVVMTANRGLCGGFNANIVRRARREIERIRSEGKEVRLICVGRKGLDVLKREYSDIIIKSFLDFGGKEGPDYSAVEEINLFIIALFEEGGFDVCTLLYNRFKNVLTQMPTMKQLIPLELPDHEEEEEEQTEAPQIYKFEPGKDKLLEMLLPKNVATQIYHAMLDNAAGEQAARMTAMDNATSSAGDMIDRLTIKYNRERQAVITTELIEIVSGAEAL